MSKGYCKLPWGDLHYRTAACAGHVPTMLLLHQSPLSSETFEPMLPLLAGWCRPYALDTPGYGASSPAPPAWEVADYAAAVWACADALGAERVILFGRATGAVFALEAALLRPERTQCLILHGLPVYTAAERAERLAGFAPPIEPRADGSHLALIWQRIQREYPWMGPELATLLVRGYLAAGADYAAAYRAIWRHALTPRQPPVATLLLSGTRDRLHYMHERAVALLPQAHAEVLEDATDFLAWQEPARLERRLAYFCAAHGSARGARGVNQT